VYIDIHDFYVYIDIHDFYVYIDIHDFDDKIRYTIVTNFAFRKNFKLYGNIYDSLIKMEIFVGNKWQCQNRTVPFTKLKVYFSISKYITHYFFTIEIRT